MLPGKLWLWVATITILLPLSATRSDAQGLSESEVTRLLSGRTITINRGPATFRSDGVYLHPNGRVTHSTWRACGSAICLASGWRGPLSVEGGVVYLTYPDGKKFNMGRKP